MRNLFIFERDLRLEDNPALFEACKSGEILPVFIYEEDKYGAANKVWLHHSLQKLQESLNGNLAIISGDSEKEINKLVKDYSIDKTFKNSYEDGAEFNGNFIFSPTDILKPNGEPYKIYTPFYKKCLPMLKRVSKPIASTEEIKFAKHKLNTNVEKLALIPKRDWHKTIMQDWTPGEIGAKQRFEDFMKSNLKKYDNGRDQLGEQVTSRLSPHLRFGEISPRYILSKISNHKNDFIREMIWREFVNYTLYHFPALNSKGLNSNLDKYPWDNSEKHFELWKHSKTGFDLVDAGMKELKLTGYMHGRARMITASFLVKNMGINWIKGAHHFRDFLLDADDSANSFGWQWSAGCGYDCQPYFRVFNPEGQEEKFDNDAKYRNKYLKEKSSPILDLKETREHFIKTVKANK